MIQMSLSRVKLNNFGGFYGHCPDTLLSHLVVDTKIVVLVFYYQSISQVHLLKVIKYQAELIQAYQKVLVLVRNSVEAYYSPACYLTIQD